MRRVTLAVVAAALAVATGPSVSAQDTASIPRTASGRPDLTGVWQGGSTQPGPWEEANAGLGVGGSGRDPNAPVVRSSNDRPAGREGAPYQDWAAAKVLEAFERRGVDDPTGHCLPAGVPRSVMLGLFPQQIVQTPTTIVILYEYMHTFRVISLDVPHPDDLIPSYMGNSVARWDGDTLVVDVTNQRPETWLDRAGNFHSAELRVEERYTLIGPNHLQYEATLEDPKVYSRPWKISVPLYRRIETNTELLEFKCVPFSEEILYGHLRKGYKGDEASEGEP
jgi:hypothetical protein